MADTGQISESSSSPDGLNPRQQRNKEETDAVSRIAQDDKLDEPAKIDAIAKTRHWFSGSMGAIDVYLAGNADAAATAAKLAGPIDESYSTADHGRALYNEEMTARNQRRHWGPEEALKMVSPMAICYLPSQPHVREVWLGSPTKDSGIAFHGQERALKEKRYTSTLIVASTTLLTFILPVGT
jgi:hypothetical protein